MPRTPTALVLKTALATALAFSAPAQGTTYTPHRPMFRIAVHDLPGLVAAVRQTALGELLAEPDVAEIFELARQRDADQVRRWTELVLALQKVAPRSASFDERAELALRAIDWRDVHGFEISASFPGGDPGVEAPLVDFAGGFTQPAITAALHPTAAGEERLRAAFDALVAELREHVPFGARPAAEQTVDDHAGLVLEPGGDADPHAEHTFLATPHADGVWLTARRGLLAGGSGSPDVGFFGPRPAREPSFVFGIDLIRYARMIASFTSDTRVDGFLQAAGLAEAGMLEWRLSASGETIRDEISLAFDGDVGGILGALVRGSAPLPDQPLPADPLLQVRCAFDVEALVAAVDELLEFFELRTLTGQGMRDDLRRAWTGGAALGLARPALGGLGPRTYLSFGIVDREALERLLALLHAQPWVTTKQRELEGVECTLLDIAGLPSALAPAYCVIDGTFHAAESPKSLRALLKAKAAGAPPVMDTRDAPRPRGDGVMLPMFDLRFDGAAIHAVFREVFMPPMAAATALGDAESLVGLREMPDVETVTRHLGKGRGALWRTESGLALSMSGALGGPETHALATMFGPILSTGVSSSRRWACESVRSRLLRCKMAAVHAAIEAFAAREGARPPSLGALVHAGDVAAEMLHVPGDDLAEPVVHEGRELGSASFRYYPDGLAVAPDDTVIAARLIEIGTGMWWREAMDEDGRVHLGWGEFADRSLDEIERAAREKKDGKNR